MRAPAQEARRDADRARAARPLRVETVDVTPPPTAFVRSGGVAGAGSSDDDARGGGMGGGGGGCGGGGGGASRRVESASDLLVRVLESDAGDAAAGDRTGAASPGMSMAAEREASAALITQLRGQVAAGAEEVRG